MRKKIIMIRGYSGAGKSTAARKFASKHRYIYLSSDSFEFDFQPYMEKTKEEFELVTQSYVQMLELFLKAGKSIILDGTFVSLHPNFRMNPDMFLQRATTYGYEISVIICTVNEKVSRVRMKVREAKEWTKPKPVPIKYAREIRRKIDASPIKGQIVIDTTNMSQDEVFTEIEKIILT